MKECIEFEESVVLYQREMLFKEKFSTLETGMYINGKIEKFKQRTFFDEWMEIMLPESFGEMPKPFVSIKYPSRFRPQIIITKADLSVNLGLTLFSQGASENDLEGSAEQIKGMLKRYDPVIQFYTQEIEETTNCQKVWFDYRTQALDEPIYNIQFLVIIKHRIMQGTFNCLYRDVDDWYEAAKQMVLSVTDMTRNIL